MRIRGTGATQHRTCHEVLDETLEPQAHEMHEERGHPLLGATGIAAASTASDRSHRWVLRGVVFAFAVLRKGT
jgi:hypothetical protein